MMQYEIEENGCWINVLGKNAKQETMVIEIVHCNNPGGNNSLPYLWYKKGWTNKVMETYIGCNTYVFNNQDHCVAQCKCGAYVQRYCINPLLAPELEKTVIEIWNNGNISKPL